MILEYRTFVATTKNATEKLNELAKEGWGLKSVEYFATVPDPENPGAFLGVFYHIMDKIVQEPEPVNARRPIGAMACK